MLDACMGKWVFWSRKLRKACYEWTSQLNWIYAAQQQDLTHQQYDATYKISELLHFFVAAWEKLLPKLRYFENSLAASKLLTIVSVATFISFLHNTNYDCFSHIGSHTLCLTPEKECYSLFNCSLSLSLILQAHWVIWINNLRCCFRLCSVHKTKWERSGVIRYAIHNRLSHQILM